MLFGSIWIDLAGVSEISFGLPITKTNILSSFNSNSTVFDKSSELPLQPYKETIANKDSQDRLEMAIGANEEGFGRHARGGRDAQDAVAQTTVRCGIRECGIDRAFDPSRRRTRLGSREGRGIVLYIFYEMYVSL